MWSPSAGRNKDVVCEQLSKLVRPGWRILEIGSGTGEHAVAFAKAMPESHWLTSDPDPKSRASIAAWIAHERLANVEPPLDLDVRGQDWSITGELDAIVSLNMIHIAPWSATLGLIAGAGRLLSGRGALILYGPFHKNGEPTSPSNQDFDESLKRRNPDWGVRDMADLDRQARLHGLYLADEVAMPANNFVLVFRQKS